MKTLLYLFSLALLLIGCDCEEIFLVDPSRVPTRFFLVQETSTLQGEGLLIQFNQPIDTSTLRPGVNLLVTGNGVGYDGAYELLGPNELAFFFCDQLFCDLTECTVEVRIVGSATNGLRSTLGDLLDGDADASPGGDFTTSLEIDNCPIPVAQIIRPGAFSENADWTTDQQLRFVVNILFSTPMDTSSVILNTNLTFRRLRDQATVNGRLQWLSPTTVRFTSAEGVGAYCCPGIELRARGDGDRPLRNRFGKALDGDEDGEAGGEYWTRFMIQG